MKSIDEIERLLGQTPAPSVVEGPHREQLKQRLLESAQSAQSRRARMKMSRWSRMSPMMKVAAGFALAAVLIGSGLAAEKVYRKFTKFTVVLERSPKQTWTLPDGRDLTVGGTIGGTVNSEDPNAVETAKRHHEEMKQLIAQKKYELGNTFDSPDGVKQYVYKFTFADGAHDTMNFAMRLEDVTSWDDYQKKQEEQQKQRHEQINKAIAAGRFRLINQDAIVVHVCREVDSNQKYRVQRIVVSDGKEIAFYRPFDNEAEEKATTMPETSWKEHLDAVREGKWELLGEETTPVYTYEVVLEDGSKTTFHYGGGTPLEKPDEKDK